MHSELSVVVVPDLTSTYGESLRKCIDGAATAAKNAIVGGACIRNIHKQGCANDSRVSTAEGSIAKANGMIRSTISSGKESDLLFGNNLREAWRAIKPLFRR